MPRSRVQQPRRERVARLGVGTPHRPRAAHPAQRVDTHGLRHFFASALIAGGASVKVVQQRLGHASAAMTLNLYAGLWPGDDELSRTVVDQAIHVLRTGCGLGEEASTASTRQSRVSG